MLRLGRISPSLFAFRAHTTTTTASSPPTSALTPHPPSSVEEALLRNALPLIPTHGFNAHTLVLASRSLPGRFSTPHGGYSLQTVNALFPSSSPSQKARRRSLNRQELVRDAIKDQQIDASTRESHEAEEDKLGPAKALVEAWLIEGRRLMCESLVQPNHLVGDMAIRTGLQQRIRYNEPVLESLSESLALLGADTTESPLSQVMSNLPIPSPSGYLKHVAEIAQDLAKTSGDESQGLSWYQVRARIGTIYGLSELHLLSPSLSQLSPPERIESTVLLMNRLLEKSKDIEGRVNDGAQFMNWVGKSWAGIGRSFGL